MNCIYIDPPYNHRNSDAIPDYNGSNYKSSSCWLYHDWIEPHRSVAKQFSMEHTGTIIMGRICGHDGEMPNLLRWLWMNLVFGVADSFAMESSFAVPKNNKR